MSPLDSLRRTASIVAAALLAATAGACGDDGSGDDDDDGPVRPRIPMTMGPWTTEFAAGDGAGREARAVWVPEDFTVGVAYFRSIPRDTDVVCEIEGVDPTSADASNERYYALEYAYQRGSWRTETIAEVLYPTLPVGHLDIALDPTTGQPAIATIAGAQALLFCQASDAGLFRRGAGGTWTGPDVAAAASGDAPVDGCPDPCSPAASNFGDVVGYYPALAFDPSGNPFLAYKDVHAGGVQADDLRRADLEAAWDQGGGWSNLGVDVSKGAGDYLQVAFDPSGAPVIAYQRPVNFAGVDPIQGLHAARWVGDAERACEARGDCICMPGWDCVRLRNGPNDQRQDVAVDPRDGTVRVVAYDPGDRVAKLWSQDDAAEFSDARTWDLESAIGDARFDEGLEPSIAIDAQGRIGVAYYRCAFATDASGSCPFEDDALVFTWREPGGDWTTEVIDQGPEVGACGRNPALVFAEQDGETTPYVAYLCQNLDGDGGLVDELWVAARDTL